MNTSQFRAPAIPLVTHDPFFSVWSFADKLTDDTTRHWDGVRKFMFGLLAVDGTVYEFMGQLVASNQRYAAGYPKLPQTSCQIRPMTTIYTFENELLTMELKFTSPLLLDDLMILSRPVSYIDYKITYKDGQVHDTHVIFGFSGEFCVNETTQTVKLGATPYSLYFTSGTENMLKNCGDDHRIEWGSFHAIAMDYAMDAMSLRAFWGRMNANYSSRKTPHNRLQHQGPNYETQGKKEYKLEDVIPVSPEYPTIILRKEFAGVGGTLESGIAVGYDDIKSIQYFGENVDAYYKKDGDSFDSMVKKALEEHDEVLQKVARFEQELMDRATKISPKFCDILCLSYRQTVAGHKLTWHDGELQFFSKENYSNGSIGTVDITYPSMPLFLIYAPQLVEGMLNPIFKMIDRGLWYYDFAPHDVGTYPLANGQTYGFFFRHRRLRPDPTDSQMPVEECGNMLLCVAALCFAQKRFDYFLKHADTLRGWAEYLERIGYDPENQLCTDDFAGHLAHNCNLSVKAICALKAYAMMLERTGDRAGAEHYGSLAKEFARKWELAAVEDGHTRLAFDQEGTWSLKYNMVWDKLLHMDLFSQEIYDGELAWYKQQMGLYGVPMDSRGQWTKTDWEMWTTVLFDDPQYTQMIVDTMWKWICEGEDRMPFSDLIFTHKPWFRGFIARTVQGGLYIPLLKFEEEG